MPSFETAKVPIEKIAEYLFSSSHPRGSLKARWFNALGYENEKPDELAESLLSLASAGVIESEKTEYGTIYLIIGDIIGPDGRTAFVQSIWIVLNESSEPRLVTVYPSK